MINDIASALLFGGAGWKSLAASLLSATAHGALPLDEAIGSIFNHVLCRREDLQEEEGKTGPKKSVLEAKGCDEVSNGITFSGVYGDQAMKRGGKDILAHNEKISQTLQAPISAVLQ